LIAVKPDDVKRRAAWWHGRRAAGAVIAAGVLLHDLER